jgi:dienelactone hydrolase
MVLTTL